MATCWLQSSGFNSGFLAGARGMVQRTAMFPLSYLLSWLTPACSGPSWLEAHSEGILSLGRGALFMVLGSLHFLCLSSAVLHSASDALFPFLRHTHRKSFLHSLPSPFPPLSPSPLHSPCCIYRLTLTLFFLPSSATLSRPCRCPPFSPLLLIRTASFLSPSSPLPAYAVLHS